ncbi:MAG: cytochrome d ubiquinol oxidase subunit II [Solirubrobacterales bacterium]|nr:cytochrome d ubiquinol oxidase subunit II [Solirubrobacterales bacterium]
MLQTLPLVFVLVGLVLYTVLAGADFGAGIWRLVSDRGTRGQALREHANHSMGPVWEANHVWLIFVLTVTWTAYPSFFGSVASTLAVALFLAGVGIILRGAGYALRSGVRSDRELALIDGAFAVASLITPFALGAAAGGIAAERVPVGNAAGDLFASWTGPVSILAGVLAVVFSAYLAAVYLAADAAREHPELVEPFRRRALAAGLAAGAVAAAGLGVLHADAHSLYAGLLSRGALACVIVSALAGAATLGFVIVGRFEAARYGAGLAVAGVIAGWAIARYPTLLPGLSVHRAAAGHDTLVTLIVAVVAGGALLFPALGLLFSLTLRGRLAPGESTPEPIRAARPLGGAVRARLAVALLIVGIGMLNAASAPWAHAVGVVSLFAFMIVAFASLVPAALADEG